MQVLKVTTMFKARITAQDGDGNWLVPNEVLLHILNFVDNRWNFAMTCKKFYELTCSIEKNARPLKLNTEKVSACCVLSHLRYINRL